MTLIPGAILYFFGPTSIAGIFAILGMVLMVVLPIYITVRYMFAFLLLADGRAGVGESFKMSAAAFRENKGAIRLFFCHGDVNRCDCVYDICGKFIRSTLVVLFHGDSVRRNFLLIDWLD